MFDVKLVLEIIKSKGFSCYALEKQLGFGNGAIKRWEKNSPSVDKICALANLLNVPVSSFFTDAFDRGVSEDAHDIAKRYDALDKDGQALVRVAVMDAEDRMKASVAGKKSVG